MSDDLPEITEVKPGIFLVDYRHCVSITSDAMLYVRGQITDAATENADIRILLDLRGMHKYALDAVAFATARRAFTVKKSAWVADERNLAVIDRVFPSTTVGHDIRSFEDRAKALTWLEK